METQRANISTIKEESIPPLFEFNREDHENVAILCGLDYTLTQDLMPIGKDVKIYADELTVSGEISLPGKNLTIIARQIKCEEGSTIDTSGLEDSTPNPKARNGDQGPTNGRGENGDPGKNGNNGNNAGNITIIALKVFEDVNIIAKGAAGGNGQEGGDGGNGGNGSWGNDAEIQHAQFDSIVKYPTKGHAGGDGGDAGDGGNAGNGGNGGTYYSWIEHQSITPQKFGKRIFAGDNAGSPGNPGKAGKGRPGGLGGRKGKCENNAYGDGDATTDCYLTDERVASGSNGNDGKTGNMGHVGTQGKPGDEVVFGVSYKGFFPYGELLGANNPPSREHLNNADLFKQLNLTFHKAKLAYLNGKYDYALEMLEWLHLFEPEPETSSQIGELYRRVEVLLAQLHNGFDFFGNPRDHIPLISLRYYQKQLDSALQLGRDIEDTYDNYIESQGDKEAQRELLIESVTKADNYLNNLSVNRKDVAAKMDQIQKIIQELSNNLSEQEIVVNSASSEFERDLEEYLVVESLSAGLKMFSSIGFMCASAVPEMKEIIDIAGKISPVEQLDFPGMVKLVRTVRGDVKALSENWNQIKNYITKENPDAAKLIMERSDFDSIMNKFAEKIPSASELIKEMHKYMDISDARNAQVFAYNASVLKWTKLDAEFKQKTSELIDIKNQLASNFDPTTHAMRSYLLGLYQGAKELLLDYLYQENQAFRYWSCSWHQLSLADNTIADLASAHLQLGKEIDAEMEKTYSRQSWKLDEPFIIKRSEAPDAFNSLLKSNKIAMSFNPKDPAFLGWSRIIAFNFAIHIKGAKTNNDKIYIRLLPGGRAPFLNEKKEEFIFSHSQINPPPVYQYKINTGEKISGGDLGGENRELIGLSPCEPWIIEVPKDLNDNLDLSQATEITLDFSGVAVPYAMLDAIST